MDRVANLGKYAMKKGMTPWNKGLKGSQVAWNKGLKGEKSHMFGKQNTLGKPAWNKGTKGLMPTPWNKGIKSWVKPWLGKHRPEITGANHYLWKGGTENENTKARKSLEYRAWRVAVFKRDNYTCQVCNKRGNGRLEADHKKPWSIFPESRFVVSNGITLCKPCHDVKTLVIDRKMIFGNMVIGVTERT